MTKKRAFSVFLVFMLALAFVFSAFACGDEPEKPDPPATGEKDPYCIKVDITSAPDKLVYNEGEIFDPVGLKFDATFVIDGKEEVIKGMSYSDCTYTHKGELLTTDVESIEFECFTYKFSVDITVNAVKYTGIELSLGDISENVFAGDTVDLTQITVTAETENGKVVLADGSYKLTDNGTEITPTAYYEMTAGKHTFGVSFMDLKDSVDVTAWDKSELTAKGIAVDTSGIGTQFVVQQYVNLKKAVVTVTYETKDGEEISVGDGLADWTVTKADGSEIANPSAYQLLEKEETFKVTAEGKETTFTLTAAYYDTLAIERRDGAASDTVTQNSDFAAAYVVRMYVDGTDKFAEVNPAQYTLTAERGGSPVEDATTTNVFSIAGEVTVTIAYNDLEASVTVTVLGGIVVYGKDNYDTDEITPEMKNYVEIPDGTAIHSPNPSDNGYEYVGDYDSGDVLIFHIWSDVAGKANVVLNAASTNKVKFAGGDQWRPTVTADLQVNTVLSVYEGKDLTEENKFDIGDDKILPGFTSEKLAYEEDDEYKNAGFDEEGRAYDNNVWTNWKPVTIGEIDLVEGDNIISVQYSGSDGYGSGKINIYSLEVQITEVA